MGSSTKQQTRIDTAVVSLIRRIARGKAAVESTPTHIRGDRSRQLEEGALQLLERLPPTLRMVALRGHFPRVLNRIAASWGDPRAFDALIGSLLIDDRQGRQGFPFEVVRELTDLREYYFSMVRPEARRPGHVVVPHGLR